MDAQILVQLTQDQDGHVIQETALPSLSTLVKLLYVTNAMMVFGKQENNAIMEVLLETDVMIHVLLKQGGAAIQDTEFLKLLTQVLLLLVGIVIMAFGKLEKNVMMETELIQTGVLTAVL